MVASSYGSELQQLAFALDFWVRLRIQYIYILLNTLTRVNRGGNRMYIGETPYLDQDGSNERVKAAVDGMHLHIATLSGLEEDPFDLECKYYDAYPVCPCQGVSEIQQYVCMPSCFLPPLLC